MSPFLQSMIEGVATLLATVLRPLRRARISRSRRRKKPPRNYEYHDLGNGNYVFRYTGKKNHPRYRCVNCDEVLQFRSREGIASGSTLRHVRYRYVNHLAGLLTRPENHCATARIEALIHLAALACCGNKEPRPRHLWQWLNEMVSDDPICQLEVPVEDVFVSNVVTWGNSRLFGGRWPNNSDHVQACVGTLIRLHERPWAKQTLRHVMALLRVSEAVADRAGIARNTRTTGRPRETIGVRASAVAESSGHVRFSDDDLVAIGVDRADLNPFVFRREHAELLGA